MTIKGTTTKGAGHSCPECERVLDTPRGVAMHRMKAHGTGAECGTPGGYQAGCRCEECRGANAGYQRAYVRRVGEARSIDGGPETLKACLLAFGVSELDLQRALGERSVQSLHWGLFRSPLAGGRFRRFCRCEVPREIADEMREAS